MELVAGGASDVGRVRTANQDSWSIGDRLWAVADGMGGHKGGEVASQLTIEVLNDRFVDFGAGSLVAAAEDANAAVHERASEHAELRGMGTTLCAMGLIDTDPDSGDGAQMLTVINVGDSRCYRWRDDEMTQITRDHSLVEDMKEAGQITEAEAAVHPHRNIVTRALGIQPEVTVDAFAVAPVAGDRYVLCSDGLFNEVPTDRISATLRRLADPQDAASELVRQANEAGGRDNVTCVIVDVLDDSGSALVDGAEDLKRLATKGHRHAPDMAGISTAHVDGPTDAPIEGAAKSRSGTESPKAETSGRPVRLRRVTWRSAAFTLGALAIVAVAVAAVGWYARGTYFVGVKDGQVTVFKGRPDRVLWFDPTVEYNTRIANPQVPEAMRDALESGKQQSSRADADAYIARMRTIICSDLRNGAVMPPSAPGAPTTTVPPACRDLAATAPAVSTTLPG